LLSALLWWGLPEVAKEGEKWGLLAKAFPLTWDTA
jgi:hypothetical protein